MPSKGWLVVNNDDKRLKGLAPVNCRARVITYAINETADYVAYDIRQAGAKQVFKVKLGNSDFDEDEGVASTELGDFVISLSGQHNVSNALAVIAASLELGLELRELRTYLEDFSGTTRRAELMGIYRGAIIIDDYAHHPTEIKTTIAGLKKKYPGKKIRVFFHPHTFTRTKALLNDFAKCFNEVDEVVVLDIFGSAREKQGTISSDDLIKKIKINNPNIKVKAGKDLKYAENYLRDTIKQDDLIVLMGAGDIYKIGKNILG